MKISYDHHLKIAGIGIVPWNRLGPEQWLPDYAIASYYGWDKQDGAPPLFALIDHVSVLPKLKKLNTVSLLQEKTFQELLNTKLSGYDLLPYKPVSIPSSLKSRKILMIDQRFTEIYENKVAFRKLFAAKLPMPEFTVQERQKIAVTQKTYQAITGGKPKVIQDEYLRGGKGTFIVRSFREFRKALEDLEKISPRERIVVSDLIPNARERSIQCCITKQGIFMGPLQRPLASHPLLTNPDVLGGDKFSGAQILASDQNGVTHERAKEIAKIIGEKLAAEGYRGIFGVDLLQASDGTLYVIEANPRLTGVTPLLTALFKGKNGVPFYLLHLLELGDYDYVVEDNTCEFNETGALLIVHSLESSPAQLIDMPKTGTYTLQNGELLYVSPNIDLKDLKRGEFIVQDYMTPGMRIRPGGRLLTLQFREQILDENTDELYNNTVEVISTVKRQVSLKPLV